MSDEASEAVNENQNRLATQEEQITKPAPKAKPQREKDPKKVAAGKKLAEKNRQAKAALEREIAEREKENENSPGWLPEMSLQTVLSIVGIVFTAIELYQRFRQKDSSGGGINTGGEAVVQSPISAITQRSPEQSADRSSERSADQRLSPKFGMA